MSCTDSFVIEQDGNPNCIKLLYISEEFDIDDGCSYICFSKMPVNPNDKIVILPGLKDDGTFFAFGNKERLKMAKWLLPDGFNIIKQNKNESMK
jgi:hypothetical protein